MWLHAAAPQQHRHKCWHRLESVQKSKLSFSIRTHLFPVPSFCWSQEDWCIRTWRQPLQSPAGASQTSSPTLMHWMALWKKERKSREQRSCSCLANTALFIAYHLHTLRLSTNWRNKQVRNTVCTHTYWGKNSMSKQTVLSSEALQISPHPPTPNHLHTVYTGVPPIWLWNKGYSIESPGVSTPVLPLSP